MLAFLNIIFLRKEIETGSNAECNHNGMDKRDYNKKFLTSEKEWTSQICTERRNRQAEIEIQKVRSNTEKQAWLKFGRFLFFSSKKKIYRANKFY